MELTNQFFWEDLFYGIDSDLIAVVIVCLLAFVIGAIVALILYLLYLQKILKMIRPENRRMHPGHVWLTIIPFFGYYYQFVLISKLADSIKAELSSRGVHSPSKPGYSVGLVMAITTCVTALPTDQIPYLGELSLIAALVTWIIYWATMARFKKQIETNQGSDTNPAMEVLDL